MTSLRRLTPGGRALTVLDVLFLAWVVLWIIVGIAVGRELHGLSELSDTVGNVGRAVSETGDAVRSLDQVPLVGGELDDVGSRIEGTGESTQESARSSRESVETLTVLLGLAIAVIPSFPVLGLYLPLRTAVARERGAVRRLLAAGGDGAALEGFLAERALQNLPYRKLQRITSEPWRTPDGEERRRLAAAEVARLGLRYRSEG